jgi:F-type H+-transporting ATPase subunit c
MNISKKLVVFASTFAVVGLWSAAAFAQPEAATAATGLSVYSWIAIAAGIGIGIAAFGGALGQGNAVAAAMEGIARNPGSRDQVFVPFILGLALIESLVIYALVIT